MKLLIAVILSVLMVFALTLMTLSYESVNLCDDTSKLPVEDCQLEPAEDFSTTPQSPEQINIEENPNPSVTQPQVPTPSPLPPVPPKPAVNLAPLPSAWYLTFGEGEQIIQLDYNVTFNGQPSVRLDPHVPGVDVNSAREVNSIAFSVKPGDRIVFSCWIKTSESGFGDTDPFSGARIGIDFYGEGLRIRGWQSAVYPETAQTIQQNYVPWGTGEWIQKTIEMVVPQTFRSDGYLGYPRGVQVNPTTMVLWMQVWSSTYGATDPGQAWFANPQLFINP